MTPTWVDGLPLTSSYCTCSIRSASAREASGLLLCSSQSIYVAKAATIMEDEYDKIYAYLDSSTYPEGLTKDGKRNWRRKCKENFEIKSAQLYHRKGERKPLNKPQKPQEPELAWSLCIKTKDEKERILRSSHATATGTR